MNPLVEQFIGELKIRNYSHRIIKSYTRVMSLYIDFSRENPETAPAERIMNFLKRWEDHPATVKQSYAALKTFYALVMKKSCPCEISGIRKNRYVPTVLNRGDIIRLLESIKNPKHRLMVSLLYGSGLRVSEVVRLRVQDVTRIQLLLGHGNVKTTMGYLHVANMRQIQIRSPL